LLYIGLAAVWGGLRLDSQVPVLFGVSFIAGIGAALFNPAVLAAPIALVEAGEVQQLTALIDSCFAIGNILGPLLSAVLYPWLGLRGLFLFNGLSYWFAAFLEAGIRPKQNPLSAGGDSQPLPKSDSPGRILSRDRVLAVMLLGFLASNLFLAPLMVFLPLFVKAAYHEQIGTLAALEAAMGIGVVVGGAFLSTVRLDSSIGVKIAVGMSAVALAYLGFILSPAPVLGILCLAVLGFFLSMTNVFSMTLFQTRLEPQNVMTFMSLVNLISVASLPFSMTVLGMTVGSMGIRTIALVCGGSLVVVTLGVIARPDIRNL
jgi:predicted MFS family arabinose efflux permease